MGDFTVSEQCHIQGRVGLAGVGGAVMRPVETRCAIVLRVGSSGARGVKRVRDFRGPSRSFNQCNVRIAAVDVGHFERP